MSIMKKTNLPTNDHLPIIPGVSTRAMFHLVPEITALLIIDIQDHLSINPDDNNEYSTSSYLFSESLPTVIPNLVKLVTTFRNIRDEPRTSIHEATASCSISTKCEVIFTFLEALTENSRDVSLDYKLSGMKLAQLPKPATFNKLPPELQPSSTNGLGDVLIPKTSCSVFQSTNIRYVLENLNIKQLVICGQLTDQCVLSAVRDAADLGFLVTVVQDACAASTLEDHERGIVGMRGFARILSTCDILNEITTANNRKLDVSIESFSNQETTKQNIPVDQKQDVNKPRIESVVQPLVSITDNCGAEIALLNALKFHGVKFLRYGAVDISNSIRTKAIPIQRLNTSSVRIFDNKVSIAKACMAGMTSFGDMILPTTGIDAKDVLVIKPDLSSLRILPYSKQSAFVLGYLCDQRTGNLSEFCSRGILKKVIDIAKEDFGIHFNVGVELEFCLVKEENESIIPVDESLFASTTTLNNQDALLNDIHDCLLQQDISIELVHAESAPGQIEIVLPYERDPLKMADNVVFARETIISMAKKYGLIAIFLPKVYKDKAGNGMHIHLSLGDDSHENIFPGTKLSSISDIGGYFLEGILSHLPALMSITMPSTNSYRRVGPGCWTGYDASWSIEDKESPLRVSLDLISRRPTNVELKLIDFTSNIYLALGSILFTGLSGIKNSSTLRPQYCSSSTLPKSLEEAISCLEKDDTLLELLGENLSKSYIAVKKAEVEYRQNFTEAVEIKLEIKKY